MQVDVDLEDLPLDSLMPPFNPFLEDFKQIREAHRDLAEVVRTIKAQVSEMHNKINKPSVGERLEKYWKEHNLLGTLILGLVTAIGGAVLYTGRLILDNHVQLLIKPVGDDVKRLSENTARIEGEIQGYFAQQHVKESKNYATEGKLDLAVASAQRAVSTIATAAENKLPAPPAYFVDTIELIDVTAKVSPSPELSRKLQDARLSLAEYRSSLAGELAQMSKLQFGSGQHGWVFGGTGGSSSAGSSIEGMYLDISHLTGDAVKVIPPLTGTLADNIRVRRSAFRGGFQTLDGIHWSDVIFIGTHIQYRGGQLDLDHLTFVGCTFEAPDSDRGATFAEYVALQLPRLSIT
jgi:hypothetical protein